MKMKEFIIIAAVAAMLAGCATPAPITSDPPKTIAAAAVQASPTIAHALQEAVWNLDQAVGIGALPADDMAVACGHRALRDAGLESIPGQPEAKSFTPREETLLGAGAAAYIRLRQVRAIAASADEPTSCDGVIGFFVRKAMERGAQLALPSGARAIGAAILAR